MSNVFTNDSYISLGLGIIFLYLLIGIWIYLLEDIRPKLQDIVYFIGNLVNQPFPKNAIKVKRISSYILLRTFDIFTFAFTLMYCSTMIYKVLSTEQVGKLIEVHGVHQCNKWRAKHQAPRNKQRISIIK